MTACAGGYNEPTILGCISSTQCTYHYLAVHLADITSLACQTGSKSIWKWCAGNLLFFGNIFVGNYIPTTRVSSGLVGVRMCKVKFSQVMTNDIKQH